MNSKNEKKKENGWLKTSYWGFVQGENFLRHFLLLFMRLYWGALLILTGINKWLHFAATAEHFRALDVPLPHLSTYSVATMELLGGISLFLGLSSRIFSLLLCILYFAAYAIAHKTALHNIFTNPSQFTSADPFPFLLTSLIILCFGPGFFSIDYWLEKKHYGAAL